MKIKQSFPKVKINLLGNLHQEKVIHVIQDDEDEISDKPKAPAAETQLGEINQQNEVDIMGGPAGTPEKKGPTIVREVVEQDNLFEIEMQVDTDIEGGIDIQNDCIHGHLMFLQVPSY